MSEMTRMWKIVIGVGAVALAASAASAAYAQAAPADRATPKNFNWEIKDGKRVPKGDRQVNADGSWREEIRQGKCVTVKEKSAAGEYKETRKCD
ncbi:hypothetical protein LZ496_07625 [Sphingomonas sp. NSE70-1]|uniref:DUF5666 domain-containing protein n=1 Tax=Sphingomonas caseinilyticus TaxID=2908205 RepID=A0ABT0RUT8_9SPHN|nr:hypothetical protein [Sphingomonas caseinilyticus]MCL6698654.1 hypothetical protein [Sphingomonas caseinilyticus]